MGQERLDGLAMLYVYIYRKLAPGPPPSENPRSAPAIGSYSPEVHTFGTLITSTKVFSLIICKTL